MIGFKIKENLRSILNINNNFHITLLTSILQFLLSTLDIGFHKKLISLHNKMSHAINGTQKIESYCVLPIPCKQVIPAKYRHLLKQSTDDCKEAAEECVKQQILMKGMCEKLAQRQLYKLQVENEKSLKQKFEKIKKKLRVISKKKQQNSDVLKYFEGKNEGPSLSQLLRMQSENVQIDRKYRSKLITRLQNIKQVSQIQKQKQNYRRWLNECNNSPLKSPNYNKMNYVLQKVKLKKNMNQLFRIDYSIDVGNTSNQNNKGIFRKMRNTDKPDYLMHREDSNMSSKYSPKSRSKNESPFEKLNIFGYN